MDSEVLACLPFLSDVPAEALRSEGHLLQPFAVGAGETLIREGETDDGLLIVVRGEVSVQVGPKRLEVARAGRGEILGETALFRPAWQRESTLRTATAATLVILSGVAIQAMRTAHSPLLAALEAHALTSLGRRLRRMALNAPQSLLQPRPPATVSWFRKVTTGWFGAPPSAPAAPNATDVLRAHHPDLTGAANLGRILTPVRIEPEQVVSSPAEARPGLRLLSEGEIELHDPRSRPGDLRVIGRLSPGDLVDPVALVHGHTATARAVATRPGWVLELSRDTVEAHLRQCGQPGTPLRQLLYTALFAELVDRNTTWYARWEAEKAA